MFMTPWNHSVNLMPSQLYIQTEWTFLELFHKIKMCVASQRSGTKADQTNPITGESTAKSKPQPD